MTIGRKPQPHWRDILPDLEQRLVPERVLIACDFDGTLSPIAPTPDSAVILPAALAALVRLSALPGVSTAVISGRALDDVAARVGLPGITYSGNHGAEIQGRDLEPMRFFAEETRAELANSLGRLNEELSELPGILIEDKGISASIHYRMVASEDHHRIAAAVAASVSTARHLMTRHGKLVWEVRPDIAWNKGNAVRHLMGRFHVQESSVFFFGDDETDNDAFRVLPEAAGFVVGEDWMADAAFRCTDPADVAELLEWIADTREHCRPGALPS